jgi:hypothetical protein
VSVFIIVHEKNPTRTAWKSGKEEKKEGIYDIVIKKKEYLRCSASTKM